jgi:alkylation response protein AidB-like acyl-CoA dehydrogenase
MTITSLLAPGTTSVVQSLAEGAVPWGLIHRFPTQDRSEVEIGDDAVRRILAVLRDVVDPAHCEEEACWPALLPAALHEVGLLNLASPATLGGAGLSDMNTQRVLTAVAGFWRPAAFLLGVHNGIGAPALEPLLGDGPLGDHVRSRLREGAVSGMADTEPEGAANLSRTTRAEPAADGSGFQLTGEKAYIGNAAIADLLLVTAQCTTDRGDRPRLFVVDTTAPGFSVTGRHQYQGLRGFANAAIRLLRVGVPAHHLIPDDDERMSPALASVLARGRLHIITPSALAAARGCLEITRAFLRRRQVDAAPLIGYEEPRRMTAEAMADAYALETVARWAMLGRSRTNVVPDQAVIKALSAELAWRVVECTMTTTAAQGWERAHSKQARGLPNEPVEQIHRDARGLRIAGGTEVLLRHRIAIAVAFRPLYAGGATAQGATLTDDRRARQMLVAHLSGPNVTHLDGLEHMARRVYALLRQAVSAHPDPTTLYARQRVTTLVGRGLEEMLAVALTLCRTASAAEAGHDVQQVCDLYCGRALRRTQILADRLARELRHRPGGFDELMPTWVEGKELPGAGTLLDTAGL